MPPAGFTLHLQNPNFIAANTIPIGEGDGPPLTTTTPEPCGPGTLPMSLEKTIQAAFGRSPGAAQVAQKGWGLGSAQPLSA